jgi:DNA repair exonuclease SbcCD nuclease subunit
MTTFLSFIGDLHLRYRVWQSQFELVKDTYRALDSLAENLVKTANKQKAERRIVILAGDVFDKTETDPMSLNAYFGFTDFLDQNNFEIYAITGNHDKPLEYAALCRLDGITKDLSKEVLEIPSMGLQIRGLPYAPGPEIKRLLNGVHENAVVIHQAFKHLLGFEGAYDLTLEDIPENIELVMVGDIHVKDMTTYGQKGLCLSSGPLHACNLAQRDEKGFWWTVDGENWSFQSISYRQVVEIDLYELSREDSISYIQELLDMSEPGWGPLVKVIHGSEHGETLTILKTKFKDTCWFFSAPMRKGGDLVASLKDMPVYKQPTMSQVLPDVVDKEEDPELFEAAQHALKGDLPDWVSGQLKERGIA